MIRRILVFYILNFRIFFIFKINLLQNLYSFVDDADRRISKIKLSRMVSGTSLN